MSKKFNIFLAFDDKHDCYKCSPILYIYMFHNGKKFNDRLVLDKGTCCFLVCLYLTEPTSVNANLSGYDSSSVKKNISLFLPLK